MNYFTSNVRKMIELSGATVAILAMSLSVVLADQYRPYCWNRNRPIRRRHRRRHGDGDELADRRGAKFGRRTTRENTPRPT